MHWYKWCPMNETKIIVWSWKHCGNKSLLIMSFLCHFHIVWYFSQLQIMFQTLVPIINPNINLVLIYLAILKLIYFLKIPFHTDVCFFGNHHHHPVTSKVASYHRFIKSYNFHGLKNQGSFRQTAHCFL